MKSISQNTKTNNQNINDARIRQIEYLTIIQFRFNDDFYTRAKREGINRTTVDQCVETLIVNNVITLVDDGVSLIFKRNEISEGLAQ